MKSRCQFICLMMILHKLTKYDENDDKSCTHWERCFCKAKSTKACMWLKEVRMLMKTDLAIGIRVHAAGFASLPFVFAFAFYISLLFSVFLSTVVTWIYVMRCVYPASRPGCHQSTTSMLAIIQFSVGPLVPASAIGTIHLCYFIPLFMTLTMAEGHKVNREQAWFAHFLPQYSSG